jgi:hypothetical protein
VNVHAVFGRLTLSMSKKAVFHEESGIPPPQWNIRHFAHM